jgi:antitoxin component YwqK of YwqJK toxin-antitoxin module
MGIYRGNFKNGQANGKGSFTSPNGKMKYEGEWTNGILLKGKVESE